mmetsp:Transcript_10098/g.14408  ORF Transcript_10098/g.14408 Transcript_10098/m.14408 type:complete len:85 (-) Transcript_10098:172-426(-)
MQPTSAYSARRWQTHALLLGKQHLMHTACLHLDPEGPPITLSANRRGSALHFVSKLGIILVSMRTPPLRWDRANRRHGPALAGG